jgi:hypothetical protein
VKLGGLYTTAEERRPGARVKGFYAELTLNISKKYPHRLKEILIDFKVKA